tara:strand:+ start:282 stop:449 length:168 start_codon:yes stop_codon:yes gene_type:complete
MNVLIVDDNLEAAEILAAARMVGCEAVETVDSGEDAIGKAILVEYDMITLDIRKI